MRALKPAVVPALQLRYLLGLLYPAGWRLGVQRGEISDLPVVVRYYRAAAAAGHYCWSDIT